MKPTDISVPDYFHKVVDCQWACPAHTPVPEYIRLIAAGRYSDAYMINWESNVFPGMLGRTCDRPVRAGLPARPRREGAGRDLPAKRVAADFKDDIRGRLPQAGRDEERQAHRAGRRRPRLAHGGARSRAAGLSLRRVRPGPEGRRHDAHANSEIPPAGNACIDEECGYILDLGVEFVGGKRIDSMKALLAEDFDAIFVGCGAPRGRDLDIPGRKEAAKNIHIGIDWLSSVSFGHIDKIGKRVIVLGGGNTAMDCCRSSRRLGGEDVKVVVRSGFEEMKASPWEKEDAMHEDIPILNYLVPKEFTHDNGKLTGMTFEKVKAVRDAKGRRKLVPTGEPDQHFPCDDVLVAVGQENAFPWIERDSASNSTSGTCRRSIRRPWRSTQSEGVLRRRRGVRPEEHHLGGGARPPGRDLDPQVLPGRGHQRAAGAAGARDQPEDGHPRVELRQRHHARQALPRAASRQGRRAARHQDRGRARLRRRAGADRKPSAA